MATVTHVRSTAVTTNSTSYATTNVNATVDEVLVIFTGASVTNVNAECSDNKGGTYTLVSSAQWGSSGPMTMNAFIGNQLVSTSSMTVTVGYTSDSATGFGVSMYSVAGLSTSRLGSALLKQMAIMNMQSSATQPTMTFGATVSSSNPTLGWFCNLTSALAITVPSGWTEGPTDFGNSTPPLGFESFFRNDTFNGSTFNWGSSSLTAWGAIAVEIDTSTMPGGVTFTGRRNLVGVGIV